MGRAVGFGVDIFRPQNHSSSRVGAIVPESGSRRLMVGSITNGLNQIIACFQSVRGCGERLGSALILRRRCKILKEWLIRFLPKSASAVMNKDARRIRS